MFTSLVLDWIKPICLPTIPQLSTINYEGAILEVAGWGKTELGKKKNYHITKS